MNNEERVIGLYTMFDNLIGVGDFDNAHKVLKLIDILEYRIQAENNTEAE